MMSLGIAIFGCERCEVLFHNQLMVMEIFQRRLQRKTPLKNFFEATLEATLQSILIRKDVRVLVFRDVVRET
jgi:hypothetical protein